MSTPPHITRACAALDGVLATPVSARALATPTFPFFQDIVAEVSGATGFGLGLYDPSELKCRTAEAKRTYISKIAGFVGASLGTPVPPKPIADAVLVGGSNGNRALAEFLVSLAQAAKGAADKAADSGRPGKPAAPASSTPASRPSSASSARGDSSSSRTAATGPSATAAAPTSRTTARATASGGRRVEAPAADAGAGGVAWTCAHCGHAHEQTLPYCELCAKLRGAPRSGRGPAAEGAQVRMNGGSEGVPEPSADWFGGSNGARSTASGGGSSSGGGGRLPRRTVEEPLRRPDAGRSNFWSTAADRDDVLDAQRQAREEARFQEGARFQGSKGGRRGAGGGGGLPSRSAPAVEHWSDDDDDFIDQHLAGRWRKSKQEQAEREAVQREHEARKAAEAAEEEAREREEASREAAAQQHDAKESEAAWDGFNRLPDDAVIKMADVPWPTLDAAALGLDGSASARKAAFRAASLRWHPDKFLQSFGSRLAADEREAILQRVTEVSQAINSLHQATS